MNRHFNNRAVSQVIAALLLIAIAVAAAILLYVFAIGLLGSLGSGGGQQTKEQVIMEGYNFPIAATSSLVITVRNVGPAAVNIGAADFFVNGVMSAMGGSCSGITLTPTQSCTATLTVTTASLVAGAAYPLKVVTPTGGVFSYTVVYGGSS
jgi:flagellin-like protein